MFPYPHLNTRGSWENSTQLCKSSTASRVCITVSNSPNSPSCLDEAMETWKTSSICLDLYLRELFLALLTRNARFNIFLWVVVTT